MREYTGRIAAPSSVSTSANGGGLGRRRSLARVLTAALGLFCVAWLDPYAAGRQANQLYSEGKYDDAVAKYNEALVDQPDSAPLHYNLGVAEYKQGKYDDALKALQQVPTSDENPKRTAQVALGIGNAKYKLGEAAEAADPKAALTHYAEALAAYRRGMGADSQDLDIKFNHEFVEKKLADLKKKLEEQQKQQEQQPNQDQQNQQGQNQQDQKDQKDQRNQQAKDDKKEDKKDEQQEKPNEQQDQQNEQQQAEQQEQQQAGDGGQAEKKDGEMSKQEAMAVLDSQRDQEVQPGDIVKKLQGAVVAEPAQDW